MASEQVNDHTFWLSRFHLLSGHNYKDIILFYSPSLNDRLCACLAWEALPDVTSPLAVLPPSLCSSRIDLISKHAPPQSLCTGCSLRWECSSHRYGWLSPSPPLSVSSNVSVSLPWSPYLNYNALFPPSSFFFRLYFQSSYKFLKSSYNFLHMI